MTDDKTEATFHPGSAPVVPGHDDIDTGERPWVSPGTPPWAGQMAERPKRTKTSPWVWVGIAAAVFGLMMCGGLLALASGGDGEPGPGFTTMPAGEVTEPPSASEPSASHPLGKTFRSGEFQYTIHAVKTGLAKVGTEYTEQKAQGAFTRLEVTVKNTGTSAMYFDADNRIKLEDAEGRQFSVDTSAGIYGNPDEAGWFTEVNPGNSVKAYVFFDLPKNVKAVRAVVSPGMLTFEADAIVPIR